MSKQNTAPTNKLFYGWIVLLGASIAMIGAGIGQWAISGLQPAMLQSTGWSRESIGLGASLNFALSAFIAPVAGYLLDRVGPRVLLPMGAVVAGASLVFVGFATEPWHFVAVYGVLVPIGLGLCYGIPNTVTAMRWFQRRAAMAVAIVIGASGLGMIITVPLANLIAASYGWRVGSAVVGVILLVLVIVGGVIQRKDPESMGLFPDGEKPDPATLQSRADYMARTTRWTIGEAMRTRSFWLLVTAQASMMFGFMAIMLHAVTWATLDLKIPSSAAVAAYTIGYVAIVVVLGLIVGTASDALMSRIGRKPILLYCTLAFAIDTFYATTVTDAVGLWIFLILFGASAGLYMRISANYMGDLFGVASLGSIMGISTMIGAVGSFLGPWYYARTSDLTGSYNGAFIVTSVLSFVAFLCLVFITQPQKKKTRVPDSVPLAERSP